jgi:hypothetical protein
MIDPQAGPESLYAFDALLMSGTANTDFEKAVNAHVNSRGNGEYT